VDEQEEKLAMHITTTTSTINETCQRDPRSVRDRDRAHDSEEEDATVLTSLMYAKKRGGG
jgi:hypothetical protein